MDQPDSFTSLIRNGANPAWAAEVSALALSVTPDRDAALAAAADALRRVPTPPDPEPAGPVQLSMGEASALKLLDGAIARQRKEVLAEAPPGARALLEGWGG